MMRINRILIVSTILLVSFFIPVDIALSDQSKAMIPDIIISGLNAYKDKGAEAAIEAWLKGSGLEGSKEALSQASLFNQVETIYGKFIDYDVIQMKRINQRSQIVYFTMNYEKGALFNRFVLYMNKNGWIITLNNYHTQPEKALPPNLLAD